MIAILRFIFSACRAGVAYIDVDGCILKKFPVPSYVPKHEALHWWKAYLQPTEIVRSRIALLYVLRVLGVGLVLWTNRAEVHTALTYRALGRYLKLFDRTVFYDGAKGNSKPMGPVMDDDAKYVALGARGSLLVESR